MTQQLHRLLKLRKALRQLLAKAGASRFYVAVEAGEVAAGQLRDGLRVPRAADVATWSTYGRPAISPPCLCFLLGNKNKNALQAHGLAGGRRWGSNGAAGFDGNRPVTGLRSQGPTGGCRLHLGERGDKFEVRCWPETNLPSSRPWLCAGIASCIPPANQ